MVDFRPFQGLRPAEGLEQRMSCVPYDVVDRSEAAELAAGNPESLLHVTRPDMHFDSGTASDILHQSAREKLLSFISGGQLRFDDEVSYYVYRQTSASHQQTGLVGLGSAVDYAAGRIKKHEFTRPDKEDDRKKNIEVLGAQLGPVFLAFRATADLRAQLSALTVECAPAMRVTAEDAVVHEVWPVSDPAEVAPLQESMAAVDALYVADGHHRTAAAARVGEGHPAGSAARYFLTVAFPHEELAILPYNRVLLGWSKAVDGPQSLLAALRKLGEVIPLDDPAWPSGRHALTFYMDGRWYELSSMGDVDETDPVASLDVSLLQDRILAPLFDVQDPRRDSHIAFVGGSRGLAGLESRVNGGAAVAFAMHPTSMDELMNIADAGEVMPPKSTWFEPKLRTGMVIHRFAE